MTSYVGADSHPIVACLARVVPVAEIIELRNRTTMFYMLVHQHSESGYVVKDGIGLKKMIAPSSLHSGVCAQLQERIDLQWGVNDQRNLSFVRLESVAVTSLLPKRP